jgi:hypothetical protein
MVAVKEEKLDGKGGVVIEDYYHITFGVKIHIFKQVAGVASIYGVSTWQQSTRSVKPAIPVNAAKTGRTINSNISRTSRGDSIDDSGGACIGTKQRFGNAATFFNFGRQLLSIIVTYYYKKFQI